ncbi:MAG: hypothetical protein LBI28_01305 [Treponema sp.]|jgi:hypothetical protein|nr:hypothetical protein [Treponema sp.]
MKNKKAHILSFVLIIVMIFLAISTSRGPDYKMIDNKMTYSFDSEYLIIKIETNLDPRNYVIEHNCVQVNFVGTRKYQVLFNYGNAYGENLGRYVIVDYPNESEQINCSDYVFETLVEDRYFVIKINKKLLIYDDVEILYIDLIYINSQESRWKEQYRGR